MSILKTIRAQLGLSNTAANNFTLDASADNGTMKLARGNAGATTQDILTVDASGATALRGTSTNNNAAAGFVGEYIESYVPVVSAISLTNTVNANITSISLTAGDWDVSGFLGISPAGTTSVQSIIGSASATSATLDAEKITLSRFAAWVPGSVQMSAALPTSRFSLASTTTIYLVIQSSFSVSTNGGWGRISARRVR